MHLQDRGIRVVRLHYRDMYMLVPDNGAGADIHDMIPATLRMRRLAR